ncbi:MAG: hypothetical protein CVT94_08965 [Bacteroidetes bacterium HGW-Bacteroidetes-11]|jgi:hypothetical protein|nr:MAG: hypothetical protein CVT94_08965 [Bacteroidetes bacterium HGW-Bacteroidetes-11]
MKSSILRQFYFISLLIVGLLSGSATEVLAQAQIEVISPNGGETWQNGGSEIVTYSYTGNPSYLTIEYSFDNGATFEIIDYVYSTSGTNQVPVFVNFNTTTQAKIRVAEYNSTPLLYDDSDASFTIVNPPYYFISPYPGEVFYQGNQITANYTIFNSGLTDLSFSSDNGASWTTIATGVFGGYYTFTAPDVISDQCRLRASQTGNPEIFSNSQIFTINPPAEFTLLSPNGGEVWTYNTLETVSWTGSNLPETVLIEYSVNAGITWIGLAYSNSGPDGGSYQVTVPQESSSIAKIRVRDYYNASAFDESDAVFTINTPPYILYSPSSFNLYYTGQPIDVSWYSFTIDNVDVAFSSDGGQTYETVATNVASPYYGSATFIAPSAPSANCVVKVSKSSDPAIFSLSETFAVVAAPVLSIISPNGGEVIDNNAAYEIQFDYSGETLYYTYLQIDFSADNGQNWQTLDWFYYLGDNNTYTWQTPGLTSNQCLIRITDYYFPFISATSSSAFTIEDFPDLQICMVGVDTTSGKNMIAWNKPNSNLITEYVVMKEGNISNQYTEIATVPADAPSVFIDESSNPRVQATRYKLTFRDAAGNLYPAELFHQTMHLTISKGVGDTWNLIWSPYIGFNVDSYNIYRGSNPSDLQMIGTVSGNFTSYSDFSATPGFVYYMVEVVNPNNCNPDGLRNLKLNSSMSNIATNYTLGLDENVLSSSLSAYPNPASEILRLTLPPGKVKSESAVLQVTDIRGGMLISTTISNSELASGYNLDVSSLKPGIYAVLIKTSEGIATKRFVRK